MHDATEDAKMMAHEADGIKELDNNLPRWWVWLFYGTILFSIPYVWFFHISRTGDSSQKRYEKEAYRARVEARELALRNASSVNLFAEPSTDAAVLAKGRGIFVANCAACHTESGAGLIGPNLADRFFIHGPTYADTVRTVREGVLEKGMLAWKNQLRPADIQAVCSYVYSLIGSNPPNPKAPEGTEYPL